MVNTQLRNMKLADSDMSDSEDEDEASRFQMAGINFGKSYFQFAQLDEEFESCIASIFNHTSGRNLGIKIELNIREVILLKIHSTMDLFCNQALVWNTTKINTKMRLTINGGTMTVSR